MTKEGKMQLVEDIIAGIVCSEVWDKEQSANPEVIITRAKLEGLLLALSKYVPFDLMNELEDSIYQYAGAYERASLLNGLHVADTLRDVAAKPSDYAELVGEKLKEGKKSVKAR